MDSFPAIREENGTRAVSARELYEYLEVSTRFNDWISRMLEYGFEEEKDFYSFLSKSEIGRPSLDYALTLDAAKEIAMIQRTDKGKAARQYFIECEKRLRKPLTAFEIMQQSLDILKAQNKRLDGMEEVLGFARTDIAETKQQVKVLEARVTTRSDYFTIAGYARLHDMPMPLKLAAKLGAQAKRLCTERDIPVEKISDPRWGLVGSYPAEVLAEVFK